MAAVYAEAEADPALLYAGLPYAYGAYGVAALKSAPCVNAANVPVPCAAGYAGYAYAGLPYALYGRKKREAEADPLLYAGVAGYPYAYAGYPYGAVAYTHPSNVGLCLNYVGQQVPC